jgi:hypothetical protein
LFHFLVSIFWLSNFLWHRNPGPVECCHESEKFFPKNVKKVEKTRKNTKKGGPEKRSFFDPFVPGAIFGVFREKHATNSPPSGTFSIFFVRPRSCFYTVPVLVVGGVQSGGNFFCSFLKTFFRVCTFVFAILGVDIIPGGGGSTPFSGFPHCGIGKLSRETTSNLDIRFIVQSVVTAYARFPKPTLYRSCQYLWPIDWCSNSRTSLC